MTVICGDVIEVMPTLGEFDLIIADPPYGNILSDSWDKIEDYKCFTSQWLYRAKKCLKSTGSIYVWCSIGPKSSSLLDIAAELKDQYVFKDMIVWAKQRGRGSRKGWLFTREEILWATKSEQYKWIKQYSTEKYHES